MLSDLEDIRCKINDHVRTKLTAKLPASFTDEIIKALPILPPTIKVQYIGVLSGEHSVCLHKTVGNMLDNVLIKKSKDGEYVIIGCKTIEDAREIVKKINLELGFCGYDAYNIDNFVKVRTSDYTSVSTMLAKIKLIPLYCIHKNNKEYFHFAVPVDVQYYDIKLEIKKTQKQAKKKFGISLKLPDKLHLKSLDIHIPDYYAINPKFLEFIINNMPTLHQLKTYMCLYQIIRNDLSQLFFDKHALVEVVHKHTGVPLSTVRHQLLDPNPLQKRMMAIFDVHIPDTIITPHSHLPSDGFFDSAFHAFDSLKESLVQKQELVSTLPKNHKTTEETSELINQGSDKFNVKFKELDNKKEQILQINKTRLSFKKNTDGTVKIKPIV